MTAAAEYADGRLLLDRPDGAVARLTIANPAKRNALDQGILDGISAALASLQGTEVRCVVITGSERMFSAGYDIGDIPEDVFAEEAEKLVAHPFAAAIDAVEAFPFPTVAALNGHAIGGGLELALSCDLRLAASGTVVGMPPAKLGLVYSHTGLRKFLDAIGAPRTRELFLTGRTIPSEEALAWGLVNAVVAPHELAGIALDWALEIAGNAPLSLQGNKRVIRELLAAEGRLDPDVEAEVVALRHACFGSADFREGVRAFAEKRAPRWQGR